MIIPDTIYNTVKLYGDKEAIICTDGRFTYSQFKERIDRLAGALHEAGIEKGDRVAALHMNCHIFLEIYYAVAQVGAVLAPLNTRLSSDELVFMIEDSGSRILFSQFEFKEKVAQILAKTERIEKVVWTRSPEGYKPRIGDSLYNEWLELTPSVGFQDSLIQPDDVAQIYYTSGSTGRPKGVIMTHKNMTTHAMGTLWEYRVTDQDVWGHIAPLFHMSDACNGWAITWAGATHVFLDKYDTGTLLEQIEHEKLTMLKLVPTMWTMLLENPEIERRDLSSVRLVISGGAPIAPALIKRIMDTFRCEYVQNYGMTESTHFLTISRLKDKFRQLPEEEKLRFRAKTGRPFLGVKIRVVDESGADVANDGKQVGEILVKGDIITPGYWNLPEENARSFKDGWLHTGDLATIDQEGYLQIVDRKKDMIITGGENVYCTEVENILYRNEKILEACVIGVPDAKWGEAVKAICVLREGVTTTEGDIISMCKQYLGHYKTPKSVDFIDELPKTGSGKIDKKRLRERYWRGMERRIGG